MTLRDLRLLMVACACHGAVALALRVTASRALEALGAVRLPASSRPMPLEPLALAASRSRRICRGSCLTEAIVLKWLAARHGLPLRLTIGVRKTSEGLRAHAWTDRDAPDPAFTPLWTFPTDLAP